MNVLRIPGVPPVEQLEQGLAAPPVFPSEGLVPPGVFGVSKTPKPPQVGQEIDIRTCRDNARAEHRLIRIADRAMSPEPECSKAKLPSWHNDQ
jgi:hypothetical protein